VAMEEEERGRHGVATRGGELGPVLQFVSWLLYGAGSSCMRKKGRRKEREKEEKEEKKERGKCGFFSNMNFFVEKYKI
jgi:hypothetical protein